MQHQRLPETLAKRLDVEVRYRRTEQRRDVPCIWREKHPGVNRSNSFGHGLPQHSRPLLGANLLRAQERGVSQDRHPAWLLHHFLSQPVRD